MYRFADHWCWTIHGTLVPEYEKVRQQPGYQGRYSRHEKCLGTIQPTGYRERIRKCGCGLDTIRVERGHWRQELVVRLWMTFGLEQQAVMRSRQTR